MLAARNAGRMALLKGERQGTAVTFSTNRLFSLDVAAPARRCMALAASGADRLNISAYQFRRGFDLAVASIAASLLGMRSMLEII